MGLRAGLYGGEHLDKDTIIQFQGILTKVKMRILGSTGLKLALVFDPCEIGSDVSCWRKCSEFLY